MDDDNADGDHESADNDNEDTEEQLVSPRALRRRLAESEATRASLAQQLLNLLQNEGQTADDN